MKIRLTNKYFEKTKGYNYSQKLAIIQKDQGFINVKKGKYQGTYIETDSGCDFEFLEKDVDIIGM